MATREIVIAYAQYVIGRVESNWTWNSVPAFDGVSNIITIGMMQNAGSNARNLLFLYHEQYPALWTEIESQIPRLANDVLNSPATWAFWANYSLYDDERIALVEILDSSDGRAGQQSFWNDMAGGYIDHALSAGMSLDWPKQLIYFMAMYHQSPQQANYVIASTGVEPTLDYLHSGCLNNGTLGIYTNRYNTVFDMLNGWDGVSPPPDFGQVTTPDYGGQTPSPGQTASKVSHIILQGDNLIVYGADELERGLICYRTPNDTWVPSLNEFGEPVPDPDQGQHVGGGDNPSANAVVELFLSWEGRFSYSQAVGRDDPVRTGYGDCSSVIWRAYWDVTGIDIGTWTGSQAGRGTEIARGTSSDALPISQMQAGDIMLVEWSYVNYNFNDGSSHVELYVGNNQLSGHGGPGYGPYRKPDAVAYARGTGCWMIKRYV